MNMGWGTARRATAAAFVVIGTFVAAAPAAHAAPQLNAGAFAALGAAGPVVVAGTPYFSAAEVRATAEDAAGLDSMKCTITDGPVIELGPGLTVTSAAITASVSAGGLQTWLCSAKNDLGSMATLNGSFAQDTTPPETNIGPIVPLSKDPITLNVTGVDGLVGSGTHETTGVGMKSIDIKIDNGPWVTTNGASASATVSTNGVHVFRYRGRDKLGNVENDHSFQVQIDKVKPTARFTGPVLVTFQPGKPAILAGTASDNYALGRTVEIRIKGSILPVTINRVYSVPCGACGTSGAWSLDLRALTPPLPVGTYTTEISVTDSLGNTSTTAGPAIFVSSSTPARPTRT